jgi:transcriptional regulator with XRE-family HTH domain
MNPLKFARARAGMSVRELAKVSGVHFTTIHDLETGKRKAAVSTLGKLAKALGTEWTDFAILASDEDARAMQNPNFPAALPKAG